MSEPAKLSDVGDTGYETYEGRVDHRCRDCKDIGCSECPRGDYRADKRCDVCRYEFTLNGPGCVPQDVIDQIKCPECGGSIDDPEDA